MNFIDTVNPLISRLLKVLLCVVILVASGTVGYCIIEGWSVAESFFMTVITLSTVGYGETNPLSPEG